MKKGKQQSQPDRMQEAREAPQRQPAEPKKSSEILSVLLVIAGCLTVLGLFYFGLYNQGRYGNWFGAYARTDSYVLPQGFDMQVTPVDVETERGWCYVHGPSIVERLRTEEVDDEQFVLGRYTSARDEEEEMGWSECPDRTHFVMTLDEWNGIQGRLEWHYDHSEEEYREQEARDRFRNRL